MKKKTPPMWTFTKTKDEWKAEPNVEFLFYMQSTKGIPYEIVLEKIKALSMSERLESKRLSWREFVKENNIDIKPIQEKNEKRKEEYKQALKEIHNL
jgi:hypothetical protein